ncbi:MAG: DUF5320 domain-containing protein [Bacillota bacterium]|nr:DUF5320 domain-containing protein [Bacillota bacterium]
MPRGDGTGPVGQGPLTGWGMGGCAPAGPTAKAPVRGQAGFWGAGRGRANMNVGLGFRGGRGRGCGRGVGRGFGFQNVNQQGND